MMVDDVIGRRHVKHLQDLIGRSKDMQLADAKQKQELLNSSACLDIQKRVRKGR